MADISERVDRVKEELEAMTEKAEGNIEFIDFLHRMALVSIFYAREGKLLEFKRDMVDNFKLMFDDERVGKSDKGDKYMIIVRNEVSSVSKRLNESIEVNIDNNVEATFKTEVSNDGRIYCSGHKGRKAKVIIYEDDGSENNK